MRLAGNVLIPPAEFGALHANRASAVIAEARIEIEMARLLTLNHPSSASRSAAIASS